MDNAVLSAEHGEGHDCATTPCVDEKVRAEGLRPKGILGGVDGPANLGDVGVFLERPHEGRDLEDVAADETLYWVHEEGRV